jgi:hypothetical protein
LPFSRFSVLTRFCLAQIWTHPDTRDTRDTRDSGLMSKLKINSYWLPIQELKTATELDLSGKGLKAEDAIVISSCIG